MGFVESPLVLPALTHPQRRMSSSHRIERMRALLVGPGGVSVALISMKMVKKIVASLLNAVLSGGNAIQVD